jgi:hypothetical protein
MTISLSEDQKIKILNSDNVYSVMQNILLREEKPHSGGLLINPLWPTQSSLPSIRICSKGQAKPDPSKTRR